jgi:hypothetical protein
MGRGVMMRMMFSLMDADGDGAVSRWALAVPAAALRQPQSSVSLSASWRSFCIMPLVERSLLAALVWCRVALHPRRFPAPIR